MYAGGWRAPAFVLGFFAFGVAFYDAVLPRLTSMTWPSRKCRMWKPSVLLIDRGGTARDAIGLPAHSKNQPAFSGICHRAGKDLPDILVAVLDGASTADLLPVRSAWKIDQPRAKFVSVPSERLLCPRSGIPTADGGR